jgi:hypothetical protein
MYIATIDIKEVFDLPISLRDGGGDASGADVQARTHILQSVAEPHFFGYSAFLTLIEDEIK